MKLKLSSIKEADSGMCEYNFEIMCENKRSGLLTVLTSIYNSSSFQLGTKYEVYPDGVSTTYSNISHLVIHGRSGNMECTFDIDFERGVICMSIWKEVDVFRFTETIFGPNVICR